MSVIPSHTKTFNSVSEASNSAKSHGHGEQGRVRDLRDRSADQERVLRPRQRVSSEQRCQVLVRVRTL